MDVYFTLDREARHEIKVKGSRFIGYANVVTRPPEADRIIRTIGKQFHDATHHCFGYRVGLEDDSFFRYSDSGEPSGTAGKPIMDAIDGKKLTNTICVVTRYFGGTKLGTGGLSRAYGQCAALTLAKGGIKKHYITVPVRIAFNYDLTGTVMQTVSHFDCRIEEKEYGSETWLYLLVRRSREEAFKRDLRNLSAGKVRFLKEEGDQTSAI